MRDQMPYIKILDIRFDLVGFNQAIGIVCDWLKRDDFKKYIVTPNPEFVIAAGKDDEFKQILSKADLSLTDGRGIQFAARFLRLSIPERIPGTDFMIRLCGRLAELQIPIFLLGGDPSVAEKCAKKLISKYPSIKIAGIFSGDANEAGDSEAIGMINNTNARFVFVAFGAPKQEKWIARNFHKLKKVNVAMGVGGAFDYISGNVNRAPFIFRRIGLEWLWRLIFQPKRFVRIFRAVIIFPLIIIRSKISLSKH